jgi:branched-chain amino acid transport system ATP-binding protein
MTMQRLLEVRDLHKTFGAVTAAADINVIVQEHDVLGLIGANGAGKTTFINLVTGYLKPDRGSIHYLGRDLTPLSPREVTRLGICRSFQIPQLFESLSVLDNLLIALGIADPERFHAWRALKRASAIAQADEILQRYGILTYRQHLAGTLPEGIRKLLDIAMATASQPTILLLDEPTSGVSVEEKFQVMDTVIEALRTDGVTVLFVEHDMDIVRRYAHQVLAFYDGRIIAVGEVENVLDNDKVRQYIIGSEPHKPQERLPGEQPC